MSRLSRTLCLLVAVFMSGSAWAGPIGPFDDGEAYLPPGPVAKWIQTRWKTDVGGHIYTGTDLIHIKKDGSIDVYTKVDLFILPGGGGGGAGTTPDDVDLVTIYGKQAPGTPKTGFASTDLVSFDPDAAIGFDGKERHWGGAGSGVEYVSYSEQWVVANQLPVVLPGADLSGFETSSATDQYRVYRTTAPLADFAVPEPSTWALAAVGLAGLVAQSRRTRRHRTPTQTT
ncbi:MAG TPA: hypothetical protein DDY91_20255 [Planctomycetaceae bacterium]|nr:hypothetical protein [Planctomycetaceae bacterium]